MLYRCAAATALLQLLSFLKIFQCGVATCDRLSEDTLTVDVTMYTRDNQKVVVQVCPLISESLRIRTDIICTLVFT